jgi:peptide/nickel transport system permease protein
MRDEGDKLVCEKSVMLKKGRIEVTLYILRSNWKRYKKNKAGVLGLFLVFFFIVVALGAPLISRVDPLRTMVGPPSVQPSLTYPMGTDDLGRDVFSGFVHGARISLFVGIMTALMSAGIGVALGAIAGYKGGKIDSAIMMITNMFLVVPSFFLCLVIVAVFGATIGNVIVVIAVLSWPSTARLIRADFMSLKETEFVEAARAIGASDLDIVLKEILPNALTSIIVNTSLLVANSILVMAGLDFLGLGDPNVPSWGKMLMNAQPFLRQSWWMALFPGIAILLTVMGYNLVGDGLNDLLNPRLKER